MANAKQAKSAKPKTDAKTVTIKLTKSPIGFNKNQATVVQSLACAKSITR